MTAKPARCPLCGSERTRVYPSLFGAHCLGDCPDCGLNAFIRGDENNFREAWAKMGAWRDGGWRDIATAPMDGSEIIAACYGDKTSGSYYWESEPNHWGETGWQEEDARGGPKLWRHPSKLDVWLPLPEPPKEEP